MGITQSMVYDNWRALGPLGHLKTRHQAQEIMNLGKARSADHFAIENRHGRWSIERRLRNAGSSQHHGQITQEI